MRIISGKYKTRLIKSPNGSITRPTTDRMRESMFSSIESRIDLNGAICFDAFAGSGALGFEALSRGASFCLFGENNGSVKRILLENINSLDLDRDSYFLYHKNVLHITAFLGEQRQAKFDLVMLDPPYKYDAESICKFVDALAQADFLASACLITYEIDAKNLDSAKMCFNKLNDFLLVHTTSMADSAIIFLQYKA